jgi:tetratricopeptide (TPR) repeat protein
MDFLDYAYLQSGQEAKARNLVDEAKAIPGASAADIIDLQNMLSARNAIELHRWKEAAGLDIPQEKVEFLDITYWTRTIGAARSGDVATAQVNVQKLSESIQAREENQRKRGNKVAPGESVDQLEAEGWVMYAEGKLAEAVTKLRSAASREEAEHSDPFAMPAREMLADLLLELKRPSEALVEYAAVLRSYPNRFDALYGSAQAAQSLGERAKASQYYTSLVAISPASADRPELRDAERNGAAKHN